MTYRDRDIQIRRSKRIQEKFSVFAKRVDHMRQRDWVELTEEERTILVNIEADFRALARKREGTF